MTTRKYSSRSQQTTLTAALTSSATSATVVSGSGLLGGITVSAGETFTVVIDPDTALEEIVDVTAVSTNTLTIVRGVDGSSGQAHSAGAVVRHMAIGRDYREANSHIEGTSSVHGVTGSVVGTTDTQTLTNKTLTSPTITGTGAIAGTFTGNLTGNVTGNLTGNVSGNAGTVTNGVYTTDTGTVTSTMIANGTIATADIADSAIATAKIADSAVTSAKIADGTIVTADLADSAVTSAKIADGTIVNADVNTSAQIAYGKLNLTNTIVNADINASAAIALSKLATDPLARANHTGTQTASTISDFDTQVRTSKVTDLAAPTGSFSMNSQKITNLTDPTLAQDAATKAYADTKIAATEKGAVNGVATLGSDGKLTTTQIPDVTITDTFVVASQAAMLALTAQVGDVAVRTDLNKSFILRVAGASTLANWQELLTPTDSVLSVDGLTGAVSLSGTYATIASDNAKLPLAGGTMTGAIAMGTNKITGLGDPTAAQDAATKNYIDTVVLAPSNLTGPITSVGNVTSIASQTGTGTKFVVEQSPTIVTPTLSGNTTAGTINNTTIPTSKTLVATDSTAYVVPSQTGNSGKALTTDGTTSSWSTTINGTAIPASKTLADTNSAQTLTNKTFTSPVLTTPSISNIDAKGDILVGTANDTLGVLTAGANGETLVADSSTSTGLRYQVPVNVNPVLNSAFQVWQRGTSIAVTSGAFPYTADRWNFYPNGANNAHTVSRQLTNDTTNLPFIQYAGRFQRNAGQTGTGGVFLCNSFETINSMPYVGKTVTFSFYARAGANFSSSGNGLFYRLYSGTGTDQLSNTGYTGAVAVIGASATLTTTWQRFTATGTVGTSATELSIEFSHTPSGTAGANDYYEITGVQLEIGSVATPFKTYAGTIQGEIDACKRYTKTTQNGGQPLHLIMTYLSAFSNSYSQVVYFDTALRTTPTMTFQDQAANSGKITVYNSAGTSTNNITPTFAYLTDGLGQTIGFRISVSGNYVYGEIYTITMNSEL